MVYDGIPPQRQLQQLPFNSSPQKAKINSIMISMANKAIAIWWSKTRWKKLQPNRPQPSERTPRSIRCPA